jgi:hypothetical protein
MDFYPQVCLFSFLVVGGGEVVIVSLVFPLSLESVKGQSPDQLSLLS